MIIFEGELDDDVTSVCKTKNDSQVHKQNEDEKEDQTDRGKGNRSSEEKEGN